MNCFADMPNLNSSKSNVTFRWIGHYGFALPDSDRSLKLGAMDREELP